MLTGPFQCQNFQIIILGIKNPSTLMCIENEMLRKIMMPIYGTIYGSSNMDKPTVLTIYFSPKEKNLINEEILMQIFVDLKRDLHPEYKISFLKETIFYHGWPRLGGTAFGFNIEEND